MDFLDPKKRKAHRTKLFLGYGLIAIALAFATTVILYQVYGFDYDPKTGEVTQNGLLYLDSTPSKSNILVNGENKGQTDKQIDIKSGNYNIELQSDGYRSWKHEVLVEGGEITRLTYPLLFPENLKTTEEQLYTVAPTIQSQSPNKRWLLTNRSENYLSFELVDLSFEPTTTMTIDLPVGILKSTGTKHQITVVQWSSDNRHVLLRHDFDTGNEYFVVDTQAITSSINVTNLVAANGSKVILHDDKFDQYYLYNEVDKTLATVDLINKTPVIIATNVLGFDTYGSDIVVFVTTKDATSGKSLIRIREGSAEYTLREISLSDKYLIDIGNYENDWYVAAGSVAEQKMYIFKNPVAAAKREPSRSPTPLTVLRSSAVPSYLSFAPQSRFIVMQNGKDFNVYDFDTARQYKYELEYDIELTNEATWMDGARLAIITDKTIVFDFDGTNIQELAAALKSSKAIYSQDYSKLFSLAPSSVVSGRFALTNTALKVQP